MVAKSKHFEMEDADLQSIMSDLSNKIGSCPILMWLYQNLVESKQGSTQGSV